MKKFIPYEKMPDDAKKWKIQASEYRLFKKVDWIVTEKVHGANFCFIVDKQGIQCAKRKEILQPEDDFFGFQILLEKLADQIKQIESLIKQPFERLSIYGELCGGEYPHPEVQADPNVQAVQTGIYYSPTIEFYAFDIAVEHDVRNYLDYEESLEIFQKVDILHAQPLYVGKFNQAIDFDININSKIPQQLGLPALDVDNKIEGVVIKPIKTILIETPKGKIRPILKKKSQAFSEDKRYHQATKWSYKINQDDVNFLMPEILLFVTENRLNNTISKIGEINQNDEKRIAQILEAFIADVIESFNEEYDGILEDVSENSKNLIVEKLKSEAKMMISRR